MWHQGINACGESSPFNVMSQCSQHDKHDLLLAGLATHACCNQTAPSSTMRQTHHSLDISIPDTHVIFCLQDA
jgi:hypothetical protein